MVHISAGSFVMGSPLGEALRRDEEVQHVVILTNDLYIGRFHVTQNEWLAITGSNPSSFPYGPQLPVESVTWNEAVGYCNLLTQAEQNNGHIPTNWVYRLPTEAEWEYCARAGTSTAFYFGNSIHGGQANFDDHYEYDSSIGYIMVADPPIAPISMTTNVGSYLPNPWGLYDMAGNVWNWCQDWHDAYVTNTVTNPTGPESGIYKVVRGGSYNGAGDDLRSAMRNNSPGLFPNENRAYCGFRIVLARTSPDTLTIPVPEQVRSLVSIVANLNIVAGIANSLDAKLSAALNVLTDANANNDGAAVNSLNAFINAVNAQRGTKISSADADILNGKAESIIQQLSGQ
jgi:formylglycine-generating enzyme required for sulfatase activity